jgi:hypothetical protein
VVEAGNQAGYVRAHLDVAHARQYAVMLASKTQAGVDTPEARRFFESFKITEVEKKEAVRRKK